MCATPLPRASDLDLELVRATGAIDRIEYFPEIGSTNDEARLRATTTDRAARVLFIAGRQTAGRGRGQNRWWTGEGSLAFSLLFDPAGAAIASNQIHLVSLATAVAVIDAVAPRAPGIEPLGLHWPNDVFLAGRKLAGILVECLADGRLIVGVGINVNNSLAAAPDDVRRVAISLVDLGVAPCRRDELLASFLSRLTASLETLAAAPAMLAARADELCLQRGRMLTLNSGARRIEGRCAGVASDGALQLETSAGLERFYSGVLENATR